MTPDENSPGLSSEELDEQGLYELPAREAMSVISPNPGGPIFPVGPDGGHVISDNSGPTVLDGGNASGGGGSPLPESTTP